ncbi:MAG TPA: PPE domain-containing protein [Pseudonocardiaceae bacterium]|nr:PPE domain-containing protein [Pseudonocardiaceae bacterium]
MGTDFNYDDTSHQVIYDQINGGSGSGPLQEASQRWQALGQQIESAGKSYVQAVINRLVTNRSGAAADASASTVSAMLPWMDSVTQITSTSAVRAQQQAEYWVTAKNSVPPVPPAPKSASFFGDPGEWMAEKMDWFPGVTSDQEQAQQRQQDAAEQARQAMRVYQASTNPNVDAAPAFTAPQSLDGSVGSLPLTAPSYGSPAYGSSYDAAGTPGLGGGGAPAHLMAAYQLPAHHQPATTTPAAHHPVTPAAAATVTQLAEGRHAAPSPGRAVSPGSWAGEPAASQGLFPGALTASTSTGGGGSRRASGRPGSAGAHLTGAGTSGPGHTGFGPRPSTEFGPRPTPGSHPAMDELHGTRGATGARAAGAASYGQPFSGGAGHNGEQDREHRSKYLLHDDSHSIVGDLPPTAPPVIGADY